MLQPMNYLGYTAECCNNQINLSVSEVEFCVNAAGWFAFVCPHCKTQRAVRIRSALPKATVDAVVALTCRAP